MVDKTMKIPKQLQSNQFRFIKIANDKSAIEKSWGKVNNYLYNDANFLSYIEENKRYGVVCGIGNLLVIDFDSQDLQDHLTDLFPETFTTKTANKQLYHLYFIADYSETIRVNNIEKKRVADVQGKGTYVVGPNTMLSNGRSYEIVKDVEIARISIDTIRKIFSPWLNIDKIRDKTNIQTKDAEIKSITEKLKVPELLGRYGITTEKNPTECPFHASVGGKCLSFTDTLWYCFHCGKGGSVIQLVMEKEGLDFHHAKKFLAEQLGVKINDVDLFIPNKEEICENYYKVHPFFYDDIGLFWFWDEDAMCYVLKDELDLMNDIKKVAAQKNFSMVNSGFWGEMNRALKLIGRNYKPKEWKQSWIQFRNVIYDIEKGNTFEPSKEYFNVNTIPHNLGSDDKTPIIDQLFTEWVGEEHVLELKELCFFCMVQGYPIHRLFFLFGQGLNGKGVYLRFLVKLVGLKNVCSSNIKKILSRPFEPAKLYKKLICQMGETNFQILEDTDVLKQLSGQDLISAEFKGKDSFDFMNNAKIIIATNCLPPTLDNTQGWFRRVKIIDFPNQFKEGSDPLSRIPEYEYDNFCKQLVMVGYDLLNRGVFTNDGSISHRQQEYEIRSNPLKQFLDINYVPDQYNKIPFFEIAEKFQNYLKERRYRVMDKREISSMLEKEGYEKRYEHVNFNGRDTKWLYIYGLIEKTQEIEEKTPQKSIQEVMEVKEVTSILISPVRNPDIKPTSMTSMTSRTGPKPNLYQAIKEIDKGKGADMCLLQSVMQCSSSDFEEYLEYALRNGNVFRIGNDRLGVLE